MASKEFEDMVIPAWKLTMSEASAKVYRVWKNAAEFETVEAESATDAISKCGTQDVFMIKFGNIDNHGILDKEELAKMQLSSPDAENPVEEISNEAAPATV